LAGAVAGSSTTYRLISVVVVAVLWEAFALAANSLLVPTFTETMSALVTMLGEPETWQALWISNQALGLGFAISLLVGIPLGFGIGRSRLVGKVADPWVNIMLVTPIAAVIPLLVMSVGIGLASRVILVILFALPMIVVNAQAGVRGADPTLLEMGRTFGAGERQLWRRVLLPGSLPAVMVGVRLGLGRGITGMILVELLMVSVGLGGLILRFKGFFQPDKLYATVILVVLEALLLISLVRVVERRVAPWAVPSESRGA
jgi:NitT/TauT family transport system permease protein